MTKVTCLICKAVGGATGSFVLPSVFGWVLIRGFGWVCQACAEEAQAIYAIGEFLKRLGGG